MTPDSLLTSVILSASPITRLGLAAPSARVREQAAADLAEAIVASLEGAPLASERQQMRLPL
ncbi:DUF6771 family protein [Sphingomonas jinjuensis]